MITKNLLGCYVSVLWPHTHGDRCSPSAKPLVPSLATCPQNTPDTHTSHLDTHTHTHTKYTHTQMNTHHRHTEAGHPLTHSHAPRLQDAGQATKCGREHPQSHSETGEEKDLKKK